LRIATERHRGSRRGGLFRRRGRAAWPPPVRSRPPARPPRTVAAVRPRSVRPRSVRGRAACRPGPGIRADRPPCSPRPRQSR